MAKFDLNNYLNNVGAEGYRKAYKKLFSELNLTESICCKDMIVITKTEYFKKLGRKCFPKKATETNCSIFDTEHFLNCVTRKLFFHDRVSYFYTKYGYIPHTFSCINPSGDTKVVRTFTYLSLTDLLEKGGYREKDILNNLNYYESSFEEESGHKVIRFISENGNACEYCIDLNRFTN